MEKPLGFVIDSSLVCGLKKLLYSLEQGPCACYEKIDRFFINLGFKHCEYDHSNYILHVHGDNLIMELYFDDLVITGNNVNMILGLKKQLIDTFEIIDLSMLHLFMGIKILQMNDGIFISQPKYAFDLFKQLNMDDYKSCAKPYQFGVKLQKDYDSPQVDATLYQ